jgi:hypothetical protein
VQEVELAEPRAGEGMVNEEVVDLLLMRHQRDRGRSSSRSHVAGHPFSSSEWSGMEGLLNEGESGMGLVGDLDSGRPTASVRKGAGAATTSPAWGGPFRLLTSPAREA